MAYKWKNRDSPFRPLFKAVRGTIRWSCQVPYLEKQVPTPAGSLYLHKSWALLEKMDENISRVQAWCFLPFLVPWCWSHAFCTGFIQSRYAQSEELISLTKIILLCSKGKALSGFSHKSSSLFLLLFQLTFIFLCPFVCPDLHRELHMRLHHCLL